MANYSLRKSYVRQIWDRDVESSITIAKLRVLEILGIPRPQVFCRGD